MKTRLLLIRHARSEWNALGRWQGRADPPLDDAGRDQARRLAQHLRGRGDAIAALYTSPLQRACETAEIVGAAFGLEPVRDERLVEYHVGVFEGLTSAEVANAYPDLWARWQSTANWTPVPDAEDRIVFCDRTCAVMDDVLARHEGQTVAVVTHGGVLGAYLLTALGMDRQRHSPFVFGNASLTVAEYDQAMLRIVALNDTCHLRSPEPESRLQSPESRVQSQTPDSGL